jgi:hypothetical protein
VAQTSRSGRNRRLTGSAKVTTTSNRISFIDERRQRPWFGEASSSARHGQRGCGAGKWGLTSDRHAGARAGNSPGVCRLDIVTDGRPSAKFASCQWISQRETHRLRAPGRSTNIDVPLLLPSITPAACGPATGAVEDELRHSFSSSRRPPPDEAQRDRGEIGFSGTGSHP